MSETIRKHLPTTSGGAGLACMSVHRAKDGSYDHYYSLEFIPPYRVMMFIRYKLNFLDHVTSLPKGRVWVEVPNHPIASRRKRRRYA